MSNRNTNSVVTDLTISFSPRVNPPSTSTLNPRRWHCVRKDLYLHTAEQSAWLHVAQATDEELAPDHLVVTDIRIGQPPTVYSDNSWESRPAGIWIQRNKYNASNPQLVTSIDVLFGVDAVDPRPQWHLLREPLQLKDTPSKTPIARLTVKRNGPDPEGGRPILKAHHDGSFKIVQLSDTHMVTGVGLCKDALGADGQPLPESVADPLSVKFIEHILDIEKPDLVVLTGDQLHHDILDSQTALFKVVAPIIERSVPWAAVFGNHDSEGDYALSRLAQMAIYQDLPFSLCEQGPKEIYGVGNYFLQIFTQERPELSVASLYFLDSHGQINADTQNPDYEAIQQSQIDWFTNTSQALRKERERNDLHHCTHTSLVFFHIPLPEFADDDSLTKTGGQRREPTEGPSINTHFYDALAKEGVTAVGCGHDHVNDFCALLKDDNRATHQGPWLCYNGGTGFGGYCSYGENRYYRRTRIWELHTQSGVVNTWKQVEYSTKRMDELTLTLMDTIYNTDTLGTKTVNNIFY